MPQQLQIGPRIQHLYSRLILQLLNLCGLQMRLYIPKASPSWYHHLRLENTKNLTVTHGTHGTSVVCPSACFSLVSHCFFLCFIPFSSPSAHYPGPWHTLHSLLGILFPQNPTKRWLSHLLSFVCFKIPVLLHHSCPWLSSP